MENVKRKSSVIYDPSDIFLNGNLKDRRFIPFRSVDIIEMCLQDSTLDPVECNLFREISSNIKKLYHFQFHEVMESLKNSYSHQNPDKDTIDVQLPSKNQCISDDFTLLLEGLLNKANYEKLSEIDLDQALHQTSIFKIKLQVNFDDFQQVLFYFRKESVKEENVKTWFGLKTKTVKFINYDRVLVYIKFSDEFSSHKSALRQYKAGSTMLKLFQNVPKADLEMLFPNTKLQMRFLDKLMIGVPAAISGGIVLATKVGATLILLGSLMGFWLGLHAQPVELDKTALLTLFIGIGALASYLWKQFNNFKNRKLRFMQTLTKNLYFKNLDNNAGVFHRLLDEAEEEECKEAILAYYFLLIQSQPQSLESLDALIEQWFKESWKQSVNFEVDDAIEKLIKIELVVEENSLLRAIPLKQADLQINKIWNNALSSN